MISGSIYRTWASGAALLLFLLVVLPACSGGEGGKEQTGRKERLTVIYSSDLLGKIRSCGCSVEDMGGLGRKASYIEDIREFAGNLLVLNVGDAFSLDLSFSQKEAQLTFDAFDLMGTDAFTPGEIEFIFGLDFLEKLSKAVSFNVLAANVVDAKTGECVLGPAYMVKELKGGTRIGITGILDDAIRFPGYIDTSAFEILPPEQTLLGILPELEEQSDFLILLSHMGLERSMSLAETVGSFDLLFVGHAKPVVKKTKKAGETLILASGGFGQYIGRIELLLSGDGTYDFSRMKVEALVEEIEIHEGVKELFQSYGVELEEESGKKGRK